MWQYSFPFNLSTSTSGYFSNISNLTLEDENTLNDQNIFEIVTFPFSRFEYQKDTTKAYVATKAPDVIQEYTCKIFMLIKIYNHLDFIFKNRKHPIIYNINGTPTTKYDKDYYMTW